jgi:hypothetical protein
VVDITNSKRVSKKQGDNSIFENISENKWVSIEKLREILTNKKHYYLSSLASAYILFEQLYK